MMNDAVISVDGLGKRYSIGRKQEAYYTLRDTIAEVARKPMRAFRSLWQRHRNREAPLPSFWALQDVTFDVQRGEVIGIIGRNGAGKSTLLKILSRITEPTAGEVTLQERVGSLLEVGTGFHPELSGRDNVYLNGAILGMKRADIRRKFDEIVAFAEVEKFIDTPVKHYSSGMYLRLAFAVAAHLEPEILLVDEVLAVGDIAFQSKCLNKMKDVSGAGRTVLFVSHNMSAVQRLCQRAIVLHEGRIAYSGTSGDAINKYLSLGVNEQAEYSQDHAPQKPINIRRVWVTNGNRMPIAEARYDEELNVLIEYEVNQIVRGCAVWILLRTIEDVPVLCTADIDVDESLLGERRPGMYRSVITLPAKMLNAGNYYLVIGITSYPALLNHDRIEAVRFTILDIGTPERLRTGNSRPGVIQPFLAWDTATQAVA